MSDLLTVENLNVQFRTRNGVVDAVKDVNLTVQKGEILGIVGESGSGKSVTSYALMRILDRAGRISNGRITYSGIDIRAASEKDMRDLRGREISMIFQNPRTALNPIRKVGHQIDDVLRRHAQATRTSVKERTIELLTQVRINNPEQRYHAYPFELSGGMCQRIGIALAIACRPQLLIADEPTTGLDVTTQKSVMDLVVDIARARGLSTILITHDLGLASAYCDRIMVMQSGLVVESAPTREIFDNPQNDYTRKLIAATPRIGGNVRDLLAGRKDDGEARALIEVPFVENNHPVLSVRNLVKEFPIGKSGHASLKSWFNQIGKKSAGPEVFRAVDDISFDIMAGESVGLLGESGCGKSTTSSMIMRLLDQTAGTIVMAGETISSVPAKNFAANRLRSSIQMVFQDPTDSLNPRFTAARSISDPIRQLGAAADRANLNERVDELATLVGLPLELLSRFPHQLSGGQKARVGIARALALKPKLLVLDEPTAALDVSVQAIVLNLLVDLRAKFGMSYLFVSHDINVVRLLCSRVIVMKSGKIVEAGATDKIMIDPETDYVRELVAAVPQIKFQALKTDTFHGGH